MQVEEDMAKEKESVYKKFSMKDILVIILALLAVIGLVVFLIIVQKKQQETQSELVEQSSEQQEEIKESEDMVKAKSTLVINEINGAGWVEVYNKENVPADATGFQLLMNGKVIYTLTDEDVIEAGGVKVFSIDAAFSDAGSDLLALVSEEQVVIDQLRIPSLDGDESYGRSLDGDASFQYMEASKETANQEAKKITKNFPVFSVPGGFYDSEFSLTIEASEGMKIFYTLDGSMPTLDSPVYEEPILVSNVNGQDNYYSMIPGISDRVSYLPFDDVDKCVVVRAVAEAEDGTVSEIVSESYFIGHENGTLYQNMPVLSIVMDPDSLFDYYDGIYVLGQDYENALAADVSVEGVANYYRGTLKDATIQYFEADKNLTYSSDVQLAVQINYGTNLPQKSFLIQQAFSPVSDGSTLSNLFSGQGDDILVLNNGRLDTVYKFREYFINQRLKTITTGSRETKPVLVFLDGEFWGLYHASSEYSTSYLAKTFSLDEEQVLVAENGVVKQEGQQALYNDMLNYVLGTDLSQDSNYQKVTEMMDVQSYLDVYCANLYLGNSEFPANQTTVFRTKEIDNTEDASLFADGRWHYLLGSMDDTMGLGDLNNYSLNTFLRPQVAGDQFLYSLMRNESFRKQFKTTFEKMANVYFSYEPSLLSLEEIKNTYAKQIVANYSRFYGDAYEEMFLEMSEDVSIFLEDRANYMLVYLDEFLELERPFSASVVEEVVETIPTEVPEEVIIP